MAVRIGFIGSGGIANHHMRNLATNSAAEMVAFSDPDVERARAAAKQYGGTAYKSYRTMLKRVDLDAVFICTPPFAHTDQEKLAIEAGCAIFIEKPIGLNIKRVEANAELIAKHGTVSSVGYNWRYTDAAQTAHKILRGKRVAVVNGAWMGGAPGVYWWRQMKLSGGQVVEQTTHIFDLARYLVGEVETVFASGTRGIITEKDMPGFDVHDASVVQLRFANGAVGNITSACIVSQGGPVDLNIFSRDLSLRIGGSALHVRKPGAEEIHHDHTNPTAASHEAFLAAVEKRDGPAILSSYEDAAKSLRVTLAANRSMETGKPVVI